MVRYYSERCRNAMKAMILAAGLGTRLQPYSLSRPKPLFPVLDRPLILWTIDQLTKAGFTSVVINTHHLSQQVVRLFTGHEGVTLQVEKEILGTGGGLRQALPSLGREPVLVVNGDIFHNIDLHWVYQQHLAGGQPITLVLHDFLRFNTVTVDGQGRITSFDPAACGDKKLAFTGIHVLDPAILKRIPASRFYNILDCYNEVIQEGMIIKCLVARDHFWTDIGTPADYLALHGALLHGKGLSAEEAARCEGPWRLGENVQVGKNVQLNDWGVIGSQAVVGDNVSLTRVVVWDGTRIPSGSVLADSIVT